MNRQEIFTDIYQKNSWRGQVSRSGPGSEGVYGEQKRQILDCITSQHSIRSVLDIGCGDLNWILPILEARTRNWDYYGIDIVNDVIKDALRTKQTFGLRRSYFQHLDIITDYDHIEIKNPDLILCLHVTLHLTECEIDKLIAHWHYTSWRLLLIQRWRKKQIAEKMDRNHDIDLELHPKFSFKRLESWWITSHEDERSYDLYQKAND